MIYENKIRKRKRNVVCNKIYIRCSALPGWNDCPRRSAASIFKTEIENAGYTLNKRLPSIGGIIGTSIHEGCKLTLDNYLDHGEYAKTDDCIEVCIEKFKTELQDGAIWDNLTVTTNDGEKQIEQMMKSYCIKIAPEIKPLNIEKYRESKINDSTILTGSCDVDTTDNNIHDTKNGQLKPFQPQLGGYSLLRKSEIHKDTNELFINHLPRVSVKKVYPGPNLVKYDTAMSEKMAYYIIHQIAESLVKFRKTKNEFSFPCNPMSIICSEKYCTAYGTNFCRFK